MMCVYFMFGCGKWGQWVHEPNASHKDAEIASYCGLFPLVLKWRSWWLGCERRRKYKRKSTLYIRVTKTQETHDLNLFFFEGESKDQKKKKSVPSSSSLWARGQARGGRKDGEEEEEGGGMKSGGWEEKQEKAGRICGDCRGAWNRCRII